MATQSRSPRSPRGRAKRTLEGPNTIQPAAPAAPTPAESLSSDAFIFRTLDIRGEGALRYGDVVEALEKRGLRASDPRLAHFFAALQSVERIEPEHFRAALQDAGILIQRAMAGRLVIPDFKGFRDEIYQIYQQTRTIDSGAVADYIPQLARVPATKYGVSVCTVDGQVFSIGDANELFSIQSTCKPINYCLALEEQGEEEVHRHVGREPSGHSFNEITLDPQRRPHNPLINAGAIMCASMIKPQLSAAERFDYVQNTFRRLAGDLPVGFDNAVYLSEKATADRNFALGYFMRENGSFPEGADLLASLDFYFQCCSLQMTTASMAALGATLARAGACPLSGETILRADTVKHCLSLMSSCGMYDFSGEFAFSIGLPAKSGVSGALLIVVPNVMGLCVWSPPLDSMGNSVRGVEFCRRLVQKYNLHNYDSLIAGASTKQDPRAQKYQTELEGVMTLCWASARGDLIAIQELLAAGVDVNAADYDGRTAIHLAASEGHARVVRFLVEHGARPEVADRWGGTPLADAQREGHREVVTYLEGLATAVH